MQTREVQVLIDESIPKTHCGYNDLPRARVGLYRRAGALGVKPRWNRSAFVSSSPREPAVAVTTLQQKRRIRSFKSLARIVGLAGLICQRLGSALVIYSAGQSSQAEAKYGA